MEKTPLYDRLQLTSLFISILSGIISIAWVLLQAGSFWGWWQTPSNKRSLRP